MHVISELSFIGMLLEEEVLTSSGYRLDALVEVNGTQVGIEVDGPSHFMNQEATGSTLLKRRQVSTLDGIQIKSLVISSKQASIRTKTRFVSIIKYLIVFI